MLRAVLCPLPGWGGRNHEARTTGGAVTLALLTAGLAAAPGAATAGGGGRGGAAHTTVSVNSVHIKGARIHFKGKAPRARATVHIQKRLGTAGHRHWKKVANTRAKRHRFAVSFKQAKKRVVYRAVAEGEHSARVVVRRPLDRKTQDSAASKRIGTAPRSPKSDACGALLTKADGTQWTCVFHDDFSGTSLDTDKWVPQEYFFTAQDAGWACAANEPDLISVGGGDLHLSVDHTPADSVWAPYCKYTHGMVSTYHKFSFEYGRVEARIRTSAYDGPGLHEAFWMWPDDRVPSDLTWPEAGEIDIAETYSGLPDIAIPYLHYTADDNGGYVPGTNTAFNCEAHRGEFNTYAMEWTPTKITFFVNGKTCLVNTSADPAFAKAYILDLTQGVGIATNAPVADTPFPATMDVDYVRVWK